MPQRKTGHVQTQVLVNKMAYMKPGQSFFVEGVCREDMEFLRRPVVRMGIGIRIVEVECDEIFQCHGVRVWREEGDYDVL
jgi:hypothetical protein